MTLSNGKVTKHDLDKHWHLIGRFQTQIQSFNQCSCTASSLLRSEILNERNALAACMFALD
jgi:hypothetical protein